MFSIRARLNAHLSDSSHWTAPDVSIACYLFYFMIEVAWTSLFHAAGGQRPGLLSEQSATTSSFKVSIRQTQKKNYALPPSLAGLKQGARTLLVGFLTKCSAYLGAQQDAISYSQVAYWLHALRLVRDVGTHRLLALVERPTPGSSAGLRVKLPISPAAAEPQPTYSHRSLPAFGRDDPFAFSHEAVNLGYCYTTAIEMAQTIEAIADIVFHDLNKVQDACRP
eukprot:361941-Chlamydomonas_euryale.AAC.4